MRILNDTDQTGAGELSFEMAYTFAPADVEKNCTECVQAFHNRSWETGASYPLANVFNIANKTGKLRLWMTGWDVDSDDAYWIENSPSEGDSWSGIGGSDDYREWNVAKREFDLDASPTQTRIGYPFRLRSIDGHRFMFEVIGSVEVTRQ